MRNLRNLQTKLFLLGLLFIFNVPLIIYIENIAQVSLLPSLSFLLLYLILITNIIVAHENIKINPFSVFSTMYSGFVFGGLYYSFSDGYFGKFIGFLNLGKETIIPLLLNAQIFSIICFVMFALGYLSFMKRNKTYSFDYNLSIKLYPLFKNYFSISICLIFIGCVYWIWVCIQLSGSVIESLLYFQVFPHFIEERKISTLPYHLSYSGVYIFLLGSILNKKKIGLFFILLSLIVFTISISTGRIAISITYLLNQLLIIYLLVPNLRKKMIYYFVLMIISAFFIFFLRIISNYYFLEKPFSFTEIDFLKTIIGGGNITDLPQLVIIFHFFELDDSILGLTLFDWVRNSFGGFLDIEPSSVGIIIKDTFLKSKSGNPTPTAIGEAFVNFNYGAPFFMFLVGVVFAFLNNWANRQRDIVLLFAYVCFITKFIFFYPKVDSTMMSNFFWSFIPPFILILIFSLFSLFLSNCINNKIIKSYS